MNTPNYQPSSQQGLNYWDTPARRASAEAPSNPNVASYQANLPQSNSAPNVASSQAHVPQNANNNQGNVRAGRPRPPDYTADEMRTIRTMMDRGDSAAAVALVLPGRSASAIHAKYCTSLFIHGDSSGGPMEPMTPSRSYRRHKQSQRTLHAN